MSRRYQLAESVQRQIAEIGDFIADDSIEAALKVYDALEDSFELLAANPALDTDVRTSPIDH